MKNLLAILFIFSGIALYSQDTLFLKNGDKKVIKLTEVTPAEIKYKRGDNLTGPDYILDRREIVKVKYANGEEEQLGLSSPKQDTPQVVKSESSGNRYLKIQHKNVFFVGEVISDRSLKIFIDEYKFPNNKPLMLEHYAKVLNYKSKKNMYTAFIPVGFVLPVVGTIVGLASAFGNEPDMGAFIFVTGVVAGAAFRISGFAGSQMFRNKYKSERVKIAILYNESK